MELKDALEYLMNYFDEESIVNLDFSNAYYSVLTDNDTHIDYDKLIEHFWCSPKGLNHCSCGSPNDCYKPIYDLLDYYMYKETISLDTDFYEQSCKYMESNLGIKTIYDSPFILYLVYEFDRVGLTEHGSSIGGSWITDLGKTIYTLLDYYFKDKENER